MTTGIPIGLVSLPISHRTQPFGLKNILLELVEKSFS